MRLASAVGLGISFVQLTLLHRLVVVARSLTPARHLGGERSKLLRFLLDRDRAERVADKGKDSTVSRIR